MSDEDEGGRCVKCGGPNTRNPHQDAGKLNKLMEVGAMWECLPCCFGRSIRARKRAAEAERETDKLRQSVRRLVGALNGWWSLDPDAPPHEWVRAERIAREARDALVNEHPELSALIDGKDGGE